KTVAMSAMELDGDSKSPEQSAEFISAPEKSGIFERPKQSSNTLKPVLTALGISLVVMGFLSWLYIEARQARAEIEGSIVEYAEPEKIEIKEGPFRQGLSDESQSFIMQLCQRIHDGPASDCERDQLLAGEFPQKTVNMPTFSIDSGPVRNQDYQECVDDGDCSDIDWEHCDIWTPRGLQIGVRMPRTLKRDE